VQSVVANLLPALNQAPIVAEVPAQNSAPDIATLTAHIRAGDEEAFRAFHQLYFDRLYQFLLLVTRGNEQEARDALQETLMRVVRYARKFDTEEALWSWLKVVARSAARDAGRKQHRYLNLLQKFALHSATQSPPATDHHFLNDLLEESLAELSARDRDLIKAKYLDGATVRDLASDSGLTEKAVESLLLRARQRIREFILQKLRAK
jgi:RNA polymerase sigma-70 factor (ECF subfamily)